MEVYEINKLIEWLKELQEIKGLSYVSDKEVTSKLNELKQFPGTRADVSRQVKLLDKHVKIGESTDGGKKTLNGSLNRERFCNKFQSVKDFGDTLRLDRSTLHRWRKSGVIAGDRKDLLLSHLVELNVKNSLLLDLEKALSHVKRVVTEENKYRVIKSTNSKEYMGVDPPTYKRWRREKYIRGIMLSEIVKDLTETIQKVSKE